MTEAERSGQSRWTGIFAWANSIQFWILHLLRTLVLQEQKMPRCCVASLLLTEQLKRLLGLDPEVLGGGQKFPWDVWKMPLNLTVFLHLGDKEGQNTFWDAAVLYTECIGCALCTEWGKEKTLLNFRETLSLCFHTSNSQTDPTASPSPPLPNQQLHTYVYVYVYLCHTNATALLC